MIGYLRKTGLINGDNMRELQTDITEVISFWVHKIPSITCSSILLYLVLIGAIRQ